MEIQDIKDDREWRKIEKSHRRGKVTGGLLLVAIGSLFLAKEVGAEIPEWIFTWKMLLIGIGIVAAIKHKFLHPAWIVLIGIGGTFLINDIFPELHIRPFLWPILIIMIGLAIVFKPRRKNMEYAHLYWKKWQHHQGRYDGWRSGKYAWTGEQYSEAPEARSGVPDEDYISATSLMGGVKKIILSKKFKGGEIVNIFGGAHIDLSQADLDENATLEITQVFGGTKLVVPSNWEIKSESVAVLGGIEDKRPVRPAVPGENNKVLVLIGTTIFGGIEIKSFD